MLRPTIALMTDFGTRDPYVAAVKGVLLSICPSATLIDITHEIEPVGVFEAALALESVCSYYPPGSVFVVIVDPEVGSPRRGLAVMAGERFFVGPDNGVLSLAIAKEADADVREIVHSDWKCARISATFHARDVFAPTAAKLALGESIGNVGPSVRDAVRLVEPPVTNDDRSGWIARVIHVDHFGNLITNLTQERLDEIRRGMPDEAALVALVRGNSLPFAKSYFEVEKGSGAVLVGGGGRLEVAVRCGNAEREYGMRVGSEVVLRIVRSR
jgi:S-adenosylmethionine hydrolase